MSMGVGRTIAGTDLAAALRQQRRVRGMSTAALAEAVGVRPSEVSRWERGESVPPPTRIRAIARTLGVDQRTMLMWIAAAGAWDAPDAPDADEVEVVIDLAPPDPFVLIHTPPSRLRPEPVPVAEASLPSPVRPRPVASVFPTPRTSLDADTYVYAASASFRSEPHPYVAGLGRVVRTMIGLTALGLLLVWAVDQLGHGLGQWVDLFGTPPG